MPIFGFFGRFQRQEVNQPNQVNGNNRANNRANNWIPKRFRREPPQCRHHLGHCNTCRESYMFWRRKAIANGKSCQSIYCVLENSFRHDNRAIPVNPQTDILALLNSFEGQEGEDLIPNAQCMVCYEKFNNTVHKPVAFQCGHVLCITCIASGQINQCPKCNAEITSVIPLFL